MSGFVKIYGSIIRSTVWQQPAPTKLVWLTMLILADSKGIVESSIPGLAATAGVSLPEVESALQTFLSPDRYSQSKADGGRRIRPVDGGWLIINHALYRERRTEKQVADAERLATRRNATCSNVATDPDPDPDPNSESDPEPLFGSRKPGPAKRATRIPEGFTPNASCISLAAEKHVDLSEELAQFIDHYTASGASHLDWQARMRTWIRNQAKWHPRGRHGPANGISEADQRMRAQVARVERLRQQEAESEKK